MRKVFSMKKLGLYGATLTFTLALTVALAGCGKGGNTGSNTGNNGGGGNAVETPPNTFVQPRTPAPAGSTVHFADTTNGGGFHILCIGTGNGGAGQDACAKSGEGPADLYGSGITFNANDTKDIIFSKP